MKICIYGFGKNGIKTYYFLKNRGIKVDYFGDLDSAKHGYVFDGIYCYSYDMVLSLDKKETAIIVAIDKPEKLVEEFQRIGFQQVMDFYQAITKYQPLEIKEHGVLELSELENLKQAIENSLYLQGGDFSYKKEINNVELIQIINDFKRRKEYEDTTSE